MSIVKKLGIGVLFFVLLAVVFSISSFKYSTTVTEGKKIQKYANPKKALLVIDVQEDFTGKTAKPPMPYKGSKEKILKINTVIKKFADKKYDVIYIKQQYDSLYGKTVSKLFLGATAIQGNPGAEIDDRVLIVSSNMFTKSISDAFSNKKFEKFLIDHSIDELYLVGLDAQYCVHLTAKGALNRSYKVNIIQDAVLLQAEDKWNDLLKLYRDEGIVLVDSEDI